jgi:hypothetical protein
VIGCFVDLGGNDYYRCLELIGCFVDLGGIDDLCCLNYLS